MAPQKPLVLIGAQIQQLPLGDTLEGATGGTTLTVYPEVRDTGLIIPAYIYPSDAVFDTLLDLKKQYRDVPVIVVLNPNSGPGAAANADYTRLIDRLIGAGIMVAGYVATGYYGQTSTATKRTAAQVDADVLAWRTLYPGVTSIFFDEMSYVLADLNTDIVAWYKARTDYAKAQGFMLTLGNPGVIPPKAFWSEGAADIIMISEGDALAPEATLKGNTTGGIIEVPWWRKGVFPHSRPTLDTAWVDMARRHVGWIYVQNDVLTNPWDTLSTHLSALMAALAAPVTHSHPNATPAAAGFMSGGDKTKLDALKSNVRAVITAAVTGGVNATTDVVFATLSIPANTLAAGDRIEVRAFGTTNNGTTATNAVFWVTVNGTKYTLGTYAMGTTAATNVFFDLDALITCRTVGTSGTLAVNGRAIRGATPAGLGTANAPTVNTTTAITVTVGCNMSVANASNGVTAQQASIALT